MTAILPSAAQLERILYHASLAPSPYNAQAWEFRLHGHQLEVCSDPAYRIMRELDPQQKERDIALGAVAENIALASLKEGFEAQVAYFPEDLGQGSPQDTVVMVIGFERRDDFRLPRSRDLHRWIEARGMNRSLYSSQQVPHEQLIEMKTIAQQDGLELHIITQRDRIAKLAALAGEAGRFKFSHQSTHQERYRYLRFSLAHAAEHRDGLLLQQFNVPAWLAQVARVGVDWPMVSWLNRLGYHHALAFIQETMLVRSAPAVCLLCSPSGERIDYLRGGRTLQRLWLSAAKYGLAVQPHSAVADLGYASQGGYHESISPAWRQRIDGFPQRLRDLFDIEGDFHVVNLFRMGYSTRTWPTRSLRKPVHIQQKSVPAPKGRDSAAVADAFYQTLTRHNAPFISAAEQQLLRRQRIGVAGCGSIGGASLEVLTRMGAEHFLLAEPDIFELNNLNRHNATTTDIGRHKAEATLERMQTINPQVQAEILKRGLTTENMAYFVSWSALIIDGIDVTTPSAIRMKVMLHNEAHRQQKVVICGYNVAGSQLLRIYDYNKGKRRPLNGKFANAKLDSMTSLEFLSKVISPLDLPIEMLPVMRKMIAGELDSMPQLGATANLFGVFSAWAVLDVLAGRSVRHRVMIDIPAVLRPRTERCKQFFARMVGVMKLKLYLSQAMKKVGEVQKPDIVTNGRQGSD